MSLDIVCVLLQPLVDALQGFVVLAWTPMTWFGFSVPPVASWFNPVLPCTLT